MNHHQGALFKLPVVILSGLTIKNYTLEKVENFKYIGAILNEDNNHQIDLQKRIQNANKTYRCYKFFFRNKNISKN
jgi:hypothetical protein